MILEEWCAERKQLMPVDRLVTLQARAIVLAATWLRDGMPI
ncbi:hypothetical protein [Nocardia sp. NPDC050710]